jgi:hypothetical protein
MINSDRKSCLLVFSHLVGSVMGQVQCVTPICQIVLGGFDGQDTVHVEVMRNAYRLVSKHEGRRKLVC